MKVVPFLSLCCSDPKLHNFLDVLDNEQLHRDRRLGGACLFRVNPTALLEFATIAISFTDVRFNNLLVMSHTECVAIAQNGYFANLREKRETFSPDLKGDVDFNTRVLAKVKKQTDGLPFDINWHFGIVLTHLAEKVKAGDPLDRVLDEVVVWPFGMPKREIFREPIQKISLEGHSRHRLHLGNEAGRLVA